MVRYRRNLVPGASYFFTVTLADRRSEVLVRHAGALRAAFRSVRQAHPFEVDAVVILPEHLHILMTLPHGDRRYPQRWMLIKRCFTEALLKSGCGIPQRANGEYALWLRRYWEHTIRDERDYERHVDYIHFNPVKHGLVSRVCDWPYSSFHRYVRRGVMAEDWAGDAAAKIGGKFGEP